MVPNAKDPQSSRFPRSNQDVPWWSDQAQDDAPLPEGYPERPDGKKVEALRRKLKKEKWARKNPKNRTRMAKYSRKVGKSAKDIGTYTLIPMLMLAGPAVGYAVGWLAERQWGGAPWTSTGGVLFGLFAAFRQIFIILARKAEADKRTPDD